MTDNDTPLEPLASGGAAPALAQDNFVVALLPESGNIKRFDKKEDAPEGSMVFSSKADLSRFQVEQIDQIAQKILKAQIPASKTKEDAINRTWTAMLAASIHVEAPARKGGSKARKVGSGKFTLVYDFDQPESKAAELYKELPPQAQTCLQIMFRGGKSEYSEDELRKLVEQHGTELKTVQEPWRIFQYYRKRLGDGGFIKAA